MKKYLTVLFAVLPWLVMAGEPIFEIAGTGFPVAGFKIVVAPETGLIGQKAALELQKYLADITGVKVTISNNPDEWKGPSIALSSKKGSFNAADLHRLDEDGFSIGITPGKILISGGVHKGVLYGVYDFLERFMGCRFWAPGEELIPKAGTTVLPVCVIEDRPAFESREVYYAGMDDPGFSDKMRTDRHAWKGGGNWGLWVHTMFTLVPPDTYFANHPEYYALMGGKRAQTQLCLSNPEVLAITIDALRVQMKDKPDARYWSVSQMDTYGNCECDQCSAIDKKEGSPAGSMIRFINQVAAAFPDKIISTLAYQYTRKAPKYIKPADNVNIMLCTIECDRSRPLEDDTSSGSFTHDLRDWSAISGNILVWDYVIQFTNMLAPFPNLPVLQPNIQLFEKYRVNSVFEQGCRGTYSENQELRQFILAKLLWNPKLNVDSLQKVFLTGYYGVAGNYIDRYLRKMESSLKASGKTLWIYGSPMQETDSFLSPEDIAEYQRLFKQAMIAAGNDTMVYRRLVRARLPLDYAMLEITKKYITGNNGFMDYTTSGWRVRPGMTESVMAFAASSKKEGVKTLHERSLPPDVYAEQTIGFFNHAYSDHLARNKDYVLETPPAQKYAADGAGSLTDGKRGSANYYVLWQGFEQADLIAVVDLLKPVQINYAGAEFLQDHASWIFYPKSLVISISVDGARFTEVARFENISFPDPVLIRETGSAITPAMARFVKFHAENIRECPDWHIGHGGKAWLFADELIVN